MTLSSTRRNESPTSGENSLRQPTKKRTMNRKPILPNCSAISVQLEKRAARAHRKRRARRNATSMDRNEIRDHPAVANGPTKIDKEIGRVTKSETPST